MTTLGKALRHWKTEYDRFENSTGNATEEEMAVLDRAERRLAEAFLKDLTPEQQRVLGIFLDKNNAAVDTLRDAWDEMFVTS